VCEPTRLKGFALDLLPGVLRGIPVSIIHHRLASISHQVRDLLSREAFDLVHAEQVQALANCSAAENAKVPIVLRAQNVESDLWRMLALRRPALSPILKREARLLSEWEAGAVRRSQATVAITKDDAAALEALAGCAGRVHHIPAPFPADLPASASSGRRRSFCSGAPIGSRIAMARDGSSRRSGRRSQRDRRAPSCMYLRASRLNRRRVW
jgi:glycosyl transferase family 4